MTITKEEARALARRKLEDYIYGSGFACMECGRKFKSVKAAERASYNGCPKCGGCDIDTVDGTGG